ncbi:multidrug DMT transporter [Haloprofundus marisrubri]|uniref:Multidrug DMT transporter n=1 Tax=Haloprofundus marisrubri TaxID=1514971 RepID=A0A0W1R4L7_9EURY|nr:DMT family transporter [Haloprofundus marisrubri]KTG08345.1 multidrug DMT transporter [Haloprofundus marisrubri]
MSLRRLYRQHSTAVLFACLAVFWGTSFVAIEVGLHYVPPLYFAGARYAVAGAVVFAYAVATSDRWLPSGRDEWLVVTIAGLFLIGAYHAFLYLGELRVSGPIAAVVISLTPILTAAVASALLPSNRLGVGELVGLGFGLVGVVVLVAPDPTALELGSIIGVVLVFLSAASFAVGSVLTRPFDSDLPLVSMEAWAMLLGAASLFVGGALRGESLGAVQVTPIAIASFLYLTFVSGVVGFLLYFELLDRTGPTEINLIGYAEPVVATLASAALVGHVVEPNALVGFVAIFVGFGVLKRDAVREFVVDDVPVKNDGYPDAD